MYIFRKLILTYYLYWPLISIKDNIPTNFSVASFEHVDNKTLVLEYEPTPKILNIEGTC